MSSIGHSGLIVSSYQQTSVNTQIVVADLQSSIFTVGNIDHCLICYIHPFIFEKSLKVL